MELIEDFPLTRINNSLYVQFMEDVDDAIQKITPEKLKITKLYNDFTAKRIKLDDSYQLQMKNNLTKLLGEKDKIRKDLLRCFLLHVEADQYNEDETKRESSRLITNRMDSYGNILRASRRNFTAKVKDAGKVLQSEPLSKEVENLGQTDNVAAFINANNAYHTLSKERTEERKKMVIKAMLTARGETDEVYRNIVSVVNSQVTLNSLMDSEESEEEVPSFPEVQSNSSIQTLEDFVKTINILIKEYREEADRTTSSDSSSDQPSETPETETPEENPEENPEEEQPTEPDDRPVVQ